MLGLEMRQRTQRWIAAVILASALATHVAQAQTTDLTCTETAQLTNGVLSGPCTAFCDTHVLIDYSASRVQIGPSANRHWVAARVSEMDIQWELPGLTNTLGRFGARYYRLDRYTGKLSVHFSTPEGLLESSYQCTQLQRQF